MRKWIEFNINSYVKVKLTAQGRELLTCFWKGSIPDWYTKETVDGYYMFQLYELISIFGHVMYMGSTHRPFINNTISFEVKENKQ